MSTPSKLTPERIAKILDLVRDCVPVSVAARKSGVSYSTLKEWRSRAEKEGGIYAEFDEAIEEAVATAETKMVKAVYEASEKDARFAQWMLERRFQGRWSPASKTKVEAKVEHSGAVDLTKLSEAEADALRELVAKAATGG